MKKTKKALIYGYLKDFALGLGISACPLGSNVYPLGVAALCGYTGNALPFGAGVILSALLLGGYRLTVALGGLYTCAIRLLFAKKAPSLTRTAILSVAFAALMFITLYFGGSRLVYDTVSALCICLLIPPTAICFAAKDKSPFFTGVYILLSGLLITRGAGITVWGYSLAPVAAVILTVAAGRKKGFPFSGVAGFVYGLGAGIHCLPVVGIFGLIHGLFVWDTPVFSVVLGFIVSVTAGGYILPSDTVMPIAVSVLAGCIASLFFSAKKPVLFPEQEVAPPVGTAALAAGFSSLSGLFYTMSDTKILPPRDQTYTDIRRRLEQVCLDCGRCGMTQSEIAAFLTESGGNELPYKIKQKCPYAQEIAAIPAQSGSEHTENIKNTFLTFGDEYRCFSNMLAAYARKAEEEKIPVPALVKRVECALEENGVYFEKVAVTGTRCVKTEIFGVRPDSIRLTAREFSHIVGKSVGRCVSPPEFVLLDEKTTAVFNTVPALRAESVKLISAKGGETVCGDSVAMFETGDNRFYSLVADGMGSGREANRVSRLACLYLEKIISVGGDMQSALLMLGDTLSRSPGETFTTIDLLEADRVLGTAKILKSGAPPSLLIRGTKQYIIKSETPPLGIIKEVSPKQTTFNLKRGDIILMVSDGVDTSPAAVSKAFSHARDLRACAGKLMEYSENMGISDDMSVCAVRFY